MNALRVWQAVVIAGMALGTIGLIVFLGEAWQVFGGFWFIAGGGMLVAFGEVADTRFGSSGSPNTMKPTPPQADGWAATRAVGFVALTIGSLLLSLPVVVQQLALSDAATEVYKICLGLVACAALLGAALAFRR